MGCDHYLYHMRKCHPEFVEFTQGMRSSDLESLFWQDHDDVKHLPAHGQIITCDDITSDLERCADRVTLLTPEIDWSGLRHDFGVPDDYVCGTYHSSRDLVVIVYHEPDNSDNQIKVTLADGHLSRYEHDVKTDHWLTDAREIRSWRNFQAVRDLLYDRIDIENTGFYDVSDPDILDEIERLDPDIIIPRLHTEGDAIVYHEWY